MSSRCADFDASPSQGLTHSHRSSVANAAGMNLSNYFLWKGILDWALAALLLVPGLPLIGLLVVLIRCTSKGPGIYRQRRVGCGGKHYTMFKLRSMRSDAEAGTGAVWASQGDRRITPLGYWLRKLHLDELPQLFNVLRGEMSLIGPRPERPEFVALLSAEIPGYADRLQVLPGVTGLAQINLPADTDLNDVRRKLVLDREYIETCNLLLDVRILCCTLLRLMGLRGERAMRLMRLQRTVTIELGNPHFSVAKTAPAAAGEREPQKQASDAARAETVVATDTQSADGIVSVSLAELR